MIDTTWPLCYHRLRCVKDLADAHRSLMLARCVRKATAIVMRVFMPNQGIVLKFPTNGYILD